MNAVKIVTILCWLVVAIVMVGLVVWFITGNLFGFQTNFNIIRPTFHIGSFEDMTGPMAEAGTYTVEADSVDSLNVDWVSGEISITPYDGSDIIITEYARRQLNEDEKLSYGVTGGTLNIRYISTPMTFNMMLTKKLEVFVPESIAEKLDVLYVNSTSAELTVSDLTVRALEIHETSGDSSILNIAADTVNVQSVSGEIDITSLDASKMTMGSVSGTITLTGVTADTVKSGTTSGEQDFEGTFTSLDLSSVSGEIDVVSTVNPADIKCGTTSGSIRITLPGNADLTVSYSTVSGDFSSEVPMITGGGAASYTFNSVSGDIRILKAA